MGSLELADPPYVVAINRKPAFVFFAVGFALSAVSAWLAYLIFLHSFDFYQVAISAVIGGILLLGLVLMVPFGRLLLIDAPGLYVDEKGILDNTRFFSLGRIDWEDVDHIVIRQAPHRPYSRYPDMSSVTVYVRD